MNQMIRYNMLLAVLLVLALAFAPSPAMAQYTATKLVANTGHNSDPTLINPWGLAYEPQGPIWVNDEGYGWTTFYSGTGAKQAGEVAIEPASGLGPGTPTGIVYNATTEFQLNGFATFFLFSTLDGTIQSWSDARHSMNLAGIDLNNSGVGAMYTGLAITNKPSGNFLYAADFANNKVDVYDGNFNFVTSFTDEKLPRGYAPFGIQDISGQVYVAFAPTTNEQGGYIDIFNEDGTFVKTLIKGAPLDHPWGVAVAPANFGPLSNSLLISNNTDTGTINGFNLTTGALVGTIANATGKAIQINQLWGIEFGGGMALNGNTNQLFFTAGPRNNNAGVFGVINSSN